MSSAFFALMVFLDLITEISFVQLVIGTSSFLSRLTASMSTFIGSLMIEVEEGIDDYWNLVEQKLTKIKTKDWSH